MKTERRTIYIADSGRELTTEISCHLDNAWHHFNKAIDYHKDRLGRFPGVFDIPEIFNDHRLIPAARAYLEYAKLKWPEEFNK